MKKVNKQESELKMEKMGEKLGEDGSEHQRTLGTATLVNQGSANDGNEQLDVHNIEKDVEMEDQEVKQEEFVKDDDEGDVEEDEDSIRYKLLLKVIDKALNKSIECLSVDNLVKCYPSFDSKTGTKYLSNSVGQINEFFISSSTKEINLILKEKSVRSKLVLLDRVIREAQELLQENNNADKLHIDKLSPAYLLEYNLLRSKMTYHESLQDKLDQLKADNDNLIKELKQVDQDNNNALGDLESSVKQMALLKESLKSDEKETEEFESFDTYFDTLAQKELLI